MTEPYRTVTTFPVMGTVATLVVPGDVDELTTASVVRTLRSLERRVTVNGPDRSQSQVEAVNLAAGRDTVRLDPEVFRLVSIAVLASRRHRGSFNALIGPVVKAWSIGFAEARVPTDSELGPLLALTDPDDVDLDVEGSRVGLRRAGMRLDLGAIAKGFAAQRAAEAYRERGIERALIDLGGNVVAMGASDAADDGFWRVGIQSPFGPRGDLVATLRLRDAAAVTSGVYERFLVSEGRRYHHMIDPLTGQPFATDLAAVTAVAEDATDADLWATVAQRGGLGTATAQVEAERGIEAIFVTHDREVTATSGVRDRLTVAAG